ncbi:hypothetical protein C2E23DRAFT_557134 [Lenzites betulinus]|nr:hypothetical protein C2E23DRAFT_557134 [Lenzites betulinus]
MRATCRSLSPLLACFLYLSLSPAYIVHYSFSVCFPRGSCRSISPRCILRSRVDWTVSHPLVADEVLDLGPVMDVLLVIYAYALRPVERPVDHEKPNAKGADVHERERRNNSDVQLKHRAPVHASGGTATMSPQSYHSVKYWNMNRRASSTHQAVSLALQAR